MLTPAWVSRDMKSPQPPVITSGIVFGLASGEGSTPAVLYAFDGATGKEMYSSGNPVAAPANLTGVTIENGRVFFTTTDGHLYAFGVFLEI
ncbi:MAG: PQQ-binding-like beta-propeller repeat protein [Bryobacteraceae bacterium]